MPVTVLPLEENTIKNVIGLTFKRRIHQSLFDLGFLNQIGSSLSEDELPGSWFEAISVIFNDWNTVLQKETTQHGNSCIMSTNQLITCLP